MTQAPTVNYEYLEINHKVELNGHMTLARMIELTNGADNAVVQEMNNGVYLTWTALEFFQDRYIRIDKEEAALAEYEEILRIQNRAAEEFAAKLQRAERKELAERAQLAKLIAKYGISE